jgi:hypothetical protein
MLYAIKAAIAATTRAGPWPGALSLGEDWFGQAKGLVGLAVECQEVSSLRPEGGPCVVSGDTLVGGSQKLDRGVGQAEPGRQHR